jgi:hypothetical protein
MNEPLDPGLIGSPASKRQQHKPELPLPKVSYSEYQEARQDDEVRQALREAQKEAELLESEGKIRV